MVVVNVALGGPPRALPLALCAVFALTYVLGGRVAAVGPRRRAPASAAAVWVLALSLLWVALVARVPEAAYLVFPLFFLYLHVLPRPTGPLAVLAATAVAVVALGLHERFTVAGVVGPVVAAGVALLIGLGYQALAREAAEREALLTELVTTRDQLAATEREQGVLTERARLAREIHDTLAQGLSSIQMLLHAAERADQDRPGLQHVRLA
ncbi:histidine kinase, partial [uncultured Pseudokineococcus sp.]|uniref:histidine kinase n=1 Tax=uncultured Pseudokineococcus sp. TaxID=1642928 RepID=UPI00342FEABF